MSTGELNASGNPVMDLRPIQRVVEILLVTSCYRNQDKLWPCQALGSCADFFSLLHVCKLEYKCWSKAIIIIIIVVIIVGWSHDQWMLSWRKNDFFVITLIGIICRKSLCLEWQEYLKKMMVWQHLQFVMLKFFSVLSSLPWIIRIYNTWRHCVQSEADAQPAGLFW